MGQEISYLISEPKAVRYIREWRGKKVRNLEDGSETIRHGGDRLAKVSLIPSKSSTIIPCQVGKEESLYK